MRLSFPISLLVVEGLTILFDRASDSGYFKGFQTNPEYYITHLQYIDYTMIFLLDETLIDCMFLLKNSLVIFKPIKTQLLHLQGILPV